MLKGLYKYIAQGVRSLKPIEEDVHRDIYGRKVENGDAFFHPQKFRGIPVFDADSILRHYSEQLKRLRDVVDIGDQRKAPNGKPLYDELYLEVLRRFVTFVHMIPASEDHHHAHTGGLLLHSIEASIESLRWSKERKCLLVDKIDLNAQTKPILDYCTWLGGLLHDVGKIMRDISVDAVEVIHPLTRLPVPMTEPVVSWHPQKESLIQWAKHNHISAYAVTWVRSRIHNRHNVDSGQILQPLLQGTYALDYILSSALKQEMYSDLVLCLSGYTSQTGHMQDCIRMGDSVSTNRALSIQYDAIRGARYNSTPTMLYHAINQARKEWDWNRVKSKGWVIGGEVYVRWSSGVDSIINASVEYNYGLPTDTRTILTIMETNGFSDLFERECPNDRIVKFCQGPFTQKQRTEITTGVTPTTWLDLVKMREPKVVFGENPVPPSMEGIVHLPSANRFYYVEKDGDTQLIESHPTTPATPAPMVAAPAAPAAQNRTPALASTTPVAASHHASTEQTESTTPATSSQKPAKSKATPKKPKAEPATKQEVIDDPLPGPAKSKSALNRQLFGDDEEISIEDTEAPDGLDLTSNEVQSLFELLQESTSTSEPIPFENTPEEETAAPQLKADPKPARPIGMKLSPTLQSILDLHVQYYRQHQEILVNATDAQERLGIPLAEILQTLKASGELKQNLMSPTVLTAFHIVDGQKIKCIPLTPNAAKAFAQIEPAPLSVMEETSVEVTNNKPSPDTSVKEPAPKKAKKSNKESVPATTSVSEAPAPVTELRETSLILANADHNAQSEPKPDHDPVVGENLSAGSVEIFLKQHSDHPLVQFLINAGGTEHIHYQGDGNLSIQLAKIPTGKFKPLSRSVVNNLLLDAGGVISGQSILIHPTNLLSINMRPVA